ncbi:hypothetical protein OG948_32985 [Embleya sp. NBC_00888]|uniref:hypothetical protein n=1 Tax=Embleya sp. NBC_00888 TaxID=2975960 RepID=UPI00386F57B6|nr:hypothetical protein OG948_32985 [Embleya sp. NBC_00888]
MNAVVRIRRIAASAGAALAAVLGSVMTATPAAADTTSGFSFNSAGEVGPGVYRESMVVGDFLFWRVYMQPGQKLSIKGSVDIPADFPYKQGPRFVMNLYNPLREAIPLLDNPTNQLVPGTAHLEATSGAWTVGDGKKYENFDGTKGSFKEFKDDKYALRGSYYIQMSITGAQGPQRGIVVPIRLEVSVEGTVVQRPDQPLGPEEEPRPTAGVVPGSPSPARSDSPVRAGAPPAPAARADGGAGSSVASDWGVPAGGALVALLVAAGLGYAVRTRFAAPAPEPVSPWTDRLPGPPPPPAAPPAPVRDPASTWRPGVADRLPGTAPESDEVTQAFEVPRRPEHPPGAEPPTEG